MKRRADSYEPEEPTPTMCDACGGKLRFMGKKACHYCQRQFCQTCIVSSIHRTLRCPSCHLHQKDLIERSHLAALPLLHLKYYARIHHYEMPLNISHEDLTNLILTRRAKELAHRTKDALRQALGESSREVSMADLDRLVEEPYVSTYSLGGGARNQGGGTVVQEREVLGGWQYVMTGDGGLRIEEEMSGTRLEGGGRRGGGEGGGRGGERRVEGGGGTVGREAVGRTGGSVGREAVGRTGGSVGSLNGLPAADVKLSANSVDLKTDLIPDIDLSVVTSLDALTSVHQIHNLSVKQLKIILQKNCINYKGCVEKEELQVRVRRLWQAKEEERIKVAALVQAGDLDAESSYLCKICMDAPVDCVLLECGHMLSCVKCGRQLAECPVCRQYVSRVVHAFRV